MKGSFDSFFTRHPGRSKVFVALFFVSLALFVYGKIISYPFVALDDGLLITQNPDVQSLTPRSIAAVFSRYDPELYIPLTFFSYQVDWMLGGGSPAVFHLHNLLLHVLNALLFSMLAALILGSRGIGILLGLLYLLHPVSVESVAWASARKDVLSTTFFLISLLAYLRFQEHRRGIFRTASVATFGLGLMAKVSIIGLPLTLLLIDAFQGRPLVRSSLRDKWPWFSLAVIFGIVALFGKSDAPTGSLTFLPLLGSESFLFSLGKIFWPLDLAVLYLRAGIPSYGDLLSFCAIAAVAAIAIGAFLSRRRLLGFAMLWFLLMLVPSFFNLGKAGDFYLGSDRYMQIPLMGLLFLLGGFLLMLWQRGGTIQKHVIAGCSLAILLFFGVQSSMQARVWESDETLFTHVLARYPRSIIARINLGNALRGAGRVEEARLEYDAAIAIRPHPQAFYNRGLLFEHMGDLALARASYEEAVARDPSYAIAYVNLGKIFYMASEKTKARGAFEKAAALAPDLAIAHFNLGTMALEERKFADAKEALLYALREDPHSLDARVNLVVTLLALGERTEAIRHAEEAKRQSPEHPKVRSLLHMLRQHGIEIPLRSERTP